MTEGIEYSTIVVSDKSGVVFTINPDSDEATILNIYTERADRQNDLGIKIKTKFQKIFVTNTHQCSPGTEENSGNAYCKVPNSGRLLLEFVGKWDGPDVSPPPTPVLNNYSINRIYWAPN